MNQSSTFSHNSIFSVQIIFLGYHFQSKKDIKFKKVNVHYSNLNQWTGNRSITNQININKSNTNKEVIARYNKPKEIKININNDLQLCIDNRISIPQSFGNKIEMEGIDYFIIKFKEKKSFEEYDKIIDDLRNFLSLATGVLVYPLEVR